MKIGPVVSAENRLTNGNCVACSRGSAYFVEYLRIYWTDFHNLYTTPFESALHANDGTVIYFPIWQGTLPWQPNNMWMSGSTWPKNWHFVEYLRIYCTDFCNRFTIWKLCMYRWWICTIFSNILKDVAMATKYFVNVRYNTAKKLTYSVKFFRIYWTYFHNIFTMKERFSCRW